MSKEQRESLREEYRHYTREPTETSNDYGFTDPTWNYAIWLEDKIIEFNQEKE